MRVLQLPNTPHFSLSRAEAERFMDVLSAEHGAVAVITCFSGHLWLRISASVYNCRQVNCQHNCYHIKLPSECSALRIQKNSMAHNE